MNVRFFETIRSRLRRAAAFALSGGLLLAPTTPLSAAGNVTAAFTEDGTLEITGDAKGNGIDVCLDHDVVLLFGVETESGPTTVNGENMDMLFVPAGGLGDVFIDMQAGHDDLTVGACDPDGFPDVSVFAARIELGEGNDRLLVEAKGLRMDSIHGGLSVFAQQGIDAVSVVGDPQAGVGVRPDIAFIGISGGENGGGPDTPDAEFVSIDGINTDIVGIFTGVGPDRVELANMELNVGLTVDTGQGDDAVVFREMVADFGFGITTLSGGVGYDFLHLSGFSAIAGFSVSEFEQIVE